MASACGVLKRTGAVTTGSGPRMRPSWLMRSAARTEQADPRRIVRSRLQGCTPGKEQVERQPEGCGLTQLLCVSHEFIVCIFEGKCVLNLLFIVDGQLVVGSISA